MASTDTSRTIRFLENYYTIVGLENACNKAVDVYIEPASKFHEQHFDQTKLPAHWSDKFKKPVVTQRDGKYVFIYRPDGLNAEAGFKARFVSKYNLAHAKHVEPPIVDVHQPIDEGYTSNYRGGRSDNRYNSGGYGGSQPRQYGGGYNNNNRRFGGRSN